MTEKHVPGVGQEAPDFALRDTGGNKIRLSEYRGQKNVILSFHPKAFTSVCSAQMLALELNHDTLNELDAVALGINVDHTAAKAAWAKALGIHKFPLLSDFNPRGHVAEKYGIMRAEGFNERSVFVVDKEGTIRFAKVYPIDDLPNLEEVLGVLRK